MQRTINQRVMKLSEKMCGSQEKEQEIQVLDIAEITVRANKL
jgi:hypothetical protein